MATINYVTLKFPEVLLKYVEKIQETPNFIVYRYTVKPGIIFRIPADHKRFRYWFTAYSSVVRLEGSVQKNGGGEELFQRRPSNTFDRSFGGERFDLFRSDDHLRRDNGVSDWVHRIKGLGNAIVPQVAYEIFKAIDLIRKHGITL